MNWFNPDEAMKTGTLTSGTSNSGKTITNFWFAYLLMRLSEWKDRDERIWRNGVIVYVLDPSQAWMRKSSVPNVMRIDYPEKGLENITYRDGHPSVSTVFDISRLSFPQRVEFANKFCKSLLDTRKNSDYDPPTFVFFEEGQLYFYQGSMRSMKKQSYAVELITVGGNYNLRYGVITQFPSMIDKLLVKMCKQRYFGWTSEPNDIGYIEDIVGKKMAQELPKLHVGEFVYSYPVRNGCTKVVKIPMFHKESPNIKNFRQNG